MPKHWQYLSPANKDPKEQLVLMTLLHVHSDINHSKEKVYQASTIGNKHVVK